MKCQKCGNELRLGNEQVGVDQNQNLVIHQFAYCDSCRMKWDLSMQQQSYSNATNDTKIENNKKETKKESVLSLISCIIASVIFIPSAVCISIPHILALPLFLTSLILSLIDLGMNNKDKKHVGSILGLIFSIIYFIMFFIEIGV